MRTCQGCAHEYADSAAYCPRCGLGPGEQLPALPEPEVFRIGRPADADRAVEEFLDARRRGRRGPLLWIAAAVVVAAAALGIWLGGGSSKQQPSSALASIAAEHGGASLPVTIPPETTTPPPTGLVGVAPAVRNAPGLQTARALLNAYFTAINNHHDYDGWRATLVLTDPKRGTLKDYQGYRTTTDSKISINGLENAGSGMDVSVSFTSHQDPKLGGGHACLNWTIRYALRPYEGSLRIDTVKGSILNKLAC